MMHRGIYGPAIDKYVAERRRLLGFEGPNPWTVGGLTPVMASPPSVTLSAANAAENISPNTFWPIQTGAFSNANGPIDTKHFRWLGCKPAIGTAYPYGTDTHSMVSVVSVGESPPQRVEFMTDAPKLNIETWGKGSYYRIQVDGQWVTQALSAQIPSDGAQYYITIDFSGVRKPRRIMIEGQSNFMLNGITLDRNSLLWRPDQVPATPRVIIAGDSWVEGTGATYQGLALTIGELFGWRDCWTSGSGGTGYIADDTGLRTTFRARITADITNNNPDIVIVMLGQNDTASSQATVQAEVALAWAKLRSENRNAKLICVGPFQASGSPSAAKLQTRDAIYAGAKGYFDLFIDPLDATSGPRFNGTYLPSDTYTVYDGTASHYVNLGWFTGTGKAGSTTGTGNSDVMIASDGAHPVQLGHDYGAFRCDACIASVFPL